MEIKAYQIGFYQIQFLKDDETLHKNCQSPYKNHPKGCPEYNNNWGCPPNAPSIQETRASLQTYRYFWIISISMPIHRSSIPFLGSFRSKRQYRGITMHLNEFMDFLREKYEDWAIFSCSHCTICKEKGYGGCTFPKTHCRFPKQMRISPEAAGIDVFKTLQHLPIKLEENPEKSLTRVALCATDIFIDFHDLHRDFGLYLELINKFQGE
ncbi:MAG: DUF2284 domain-containing protein [Promethearchaeota archaeon]